MTISEESNPAPPQEKSLTIDVIGFPISALPFSEQVKTIMEWAQANASKVVCSANVNILIEGRRNPRFLNTLLESNLLMAEDSLLAIAMNWMGVRRVETTCSLDLFLELCEQAQAKGVSIFFVGSTNSVLSEVHKRLSNEFPNLQIAGMVSPPFRPATKKENKELIEHINSSGAGLLFVSLGCPKQENWMIHHRGQIQSTMIGVGSVPVIYSGILKWAPLVIRKAGLEWLYRLIQEPKRLLRRYASTMPLFVWLASNQILITLFGFLLISIRRLFIARLFELKRVSIIKAFPEEWQAEFAILQARLERKKLSRWRIRYKMFVSLLQMVWAWTRIKLDNLWLRSQKRDG